MRKTATLLILVGLLFTTLTLPFSGIDLLLDPVGFLLIFNGARPLAKYGDRFGPCVPLSILLIAASAVQLFLTGTPLVVAGLLRALAEAALYLLLLRGYARLARRRKGNGMAAVLAAGFALAALATLAQAALGFIAWAPAPAFAWGLLAARLAAPAALLWPAFTLDDTRPAPPA